MNETRKNYTIYENVSIECTVNYYGNKDLPEISWLRNETEFQKTSVITNQTSLTSIISFNPPKRNDSGIYSCSVLKNNLRDSNSNLSIKFNLSFQCKNLISLNIH